MDDILSWFEQIFGWVPQWLVGLGLVFGAIVVALFVYGIAARIIKRAIGERWPAVTLLLQRVAGPARLALCLVAVALVLPLAPLNDVLREQLRHFFIVAVIALIGWITVRAVDMGAARYLQRFRLDTDENFLARKHVTQVRVFKRVIDTLIVIIAISTALMTFESVKQYGVSLFASAGAAGLIVGLAARPLLSNLIAGVQIALTQPIRLEDAVVVEGEWGWVEEIASTYVVVRLWDWRRMVLPLSYFLERPFQNWTRETASLIGSVFLHVDYSVPVEAVRRELAEIAGASPLWDGRVVNLQVSDAREGAVELRALVSARNATQAWDLRCEVREKLVGFLQREYPHALPTARVQLQAQVADAGRTGAASRQHRHNRHAA